MGIKLYSGSGSGNLKLAGSGALSANMSTLQKGLVGHWALDSIHGAKDLTPNSNNGTGAGGIVIGGATDRHGQVGKATLFDGADDYVPLGDILEDTFTGANKKFSISAWINQTTTSASTKIILSKLGDSISGGNQRQYSLFVYNGKLYFTYYGDLLGNSIRQFQADTTTITAGQWYNISMTYDGTLTYNSRVTISINGVNQTLSISYTAGNPTSIPDGTAPLTIGAARNTSTAYVFNGFLSDVRIYNRILSQAEITMLYEGYYV